MSYSDEDVRELRSQIAKQNKVLKEQHEILKRIQDPPASMGIVVRGGLSPLVVSHDGLSEISSMLMVKAGDIVKITIPTEEKPVQTVISVEKGLSYNGDVATFVKEVDGMLRVNHRGEDKLVFAGQIKSPMIGDNIVIDPTGSIGLQNIGQEEETFTFDSTNLTWDDIGGQVEAKSILREAIELPLTHPHLFKQYNKVPLKGAILSGSPGNGKTMLGKAAASAMAKLYKKDNVNPFLYIKGAELLNSYVGATESAIRAVFDRARRYVHIHSSPVVIFFDEAEALFRARGSGISSDTLDTIVPTILSELDGFEETGAFVLMATNRIDMIDPAVIRDGRISRVIQVERPTMEVTKEIFEIHMRNKPVSKDYTRVKLSAIATEMMFDTQRKLDKTKTLKEVISGAMIAGTVDRALSVAMHRDIKSKAKKVSGLNENDLLFAVNQVQAEQQLQIWRTQ